MINFKSAGFTDIGKKRERNEDAFLNLPEKKLWCVADGMGGHQDGHIASRMLIEGLADLELDADFNARINQVRQAIHDVNLKLTLTKTVVVDAPTAIIGSTVVALVLDENKMACIWAGDSRCYLLRNKTIYQITKDHTIWQELVTNEKLSIAKAKKQKGSHALTRAIGVTPDLKLEMVEMDVHPSDCFLLCSDGLYQYVTYDQVYFALNKASPKLATEQLYYDVLSTEAKDNLTAIVIK